MSETTDPLPELVSERVASFAPCFREWMPDLKDPSQFQPPTLSMDRILSLLGDPPDLDPARLHPQIDRATLAVIDAMLQADPRFNQCFVDTVPHPVVAKMIAATRIKELARARIVKKGGGAGLRYDVTDLAATFYGKKILETLGFQRRRVIQASELPSLQAVCQKFKLTLPEAVQPTTTERYFAETSPDP